MQPNRMLHDVCVEQSAQPAEPTLSICRKNFVTAVQWMAASLSPTSHFTRKSISVSHFSFSQLILKFNVIMCRKRTDAVVRRH